MASSPVRPSSSTASAATQQQTDCRHRRARTQGRPARCHHSQLRDRAQRDVDEDRPHFLHGIFSSKRAQPRDRRHVRRRRPNHSLDSSRRSLGSHRSVLERPFLRRSLRQHDRRQRGSSSHDRRQSGRSFRSSGHDERPGQYLHGLDVPRHEGRWLHPRGWRQRRQPARRNDPPLGRRSNRHHRSPCSRKRHHPRSQLAGRRTIRRWRAATRPLPSTLAAPSSVGPRRE